MSIKQPSAKVEAVEMLHTIASLCEALDLAIKGSESDCVDALRELLRDIQIKVVVARESIEAL